MSEKARNGRQFIPFEEARAFVRKLNIPNAQGWQRVCREGEKPEGVPARPDVVYKEGAWISWQDFLGTSWPPFEEARERARALGLNNLKEWQEWAKSGSRPKDMPSFPYRVYRDQWAGWLDWLGRKTKKGDEE